MSTKPCPRCSGTGRVADGRRKLTPEDATEIRDRAGRGEMQKRLAIEFGVTEASISRIVLRYGPRR